MEEEDGKKKETKKISNSVKKKNNSQCGLIDIKNDDETSFYWCMTYHSSTKELSVLKKLEDK